MDEYTFTGDQLDKLLNGVISLRDEYVTMHGKSADFARNAAINDTLDGLDAEKELLAIGEQFTSSQILRSVPQQAIARGRTRAGQSLPISPASGHG